MTGGHLAYRQGQARRLPLLLKVNDFRLDGVGRPGERLRAVASLAGTSTVSGDTTMAEAYGEVFARESRIAAGRLLYLCVVVPGVELGTWS